MKSNLFEWLLFTICLIAVQFITSCKDSPEDSIINCMIADSSRILLGTSSGVYSSIDGGVSWEDIHDNTITSLLVDNQGGVFAGTLDGLFFQENESEKWIKVGFPERLKYEDRVLSGYDGAGMFLAERKNKQIFAGTSLGVFFSPNRGKTWRWAGLKGIGIKALTIDGEGNIWAGTSGKGVFRSSDAGKSWEKINDEKFEDISVTSISIAKNGNVYIGTWDNYLFRSTDNGKNWDQLINGLQESEINAIAFGANDRLFITNNSTIYYSDDYGDNWESVAVNFIEIFTCFAYVDNGILWAGTYEGNLYISEDNGHFWSLVIGEL